MKVGIITLNNRINLEGKNIRSKEAIWLEKYLSYFYKDKVDFISRKIKKEKDINNYIDINSLINFKDYETLYIHNFNVNFFGGVCSSEVLRTIRMLNQFNGNIYYYITDPKLYIKNIAEIIYQRQVGGKIKFDEEVDPLTIKEVKEFGEVIKRMKAVFTGYNYDLFIKKLNPDIILQPHNIIPIFDFMFINDTPKELIEQEKIYDVCYYGNNRGGHRIKRFKHYFNNSELKTHVMGFDIDILNNTCDKYQDNSKLLSLINQSQASIVIGDIEHENTWITARYFENIRAEVISFIDLAYDNEKKLIDNKDLKDVVYVNSPSDIYSIVNHLKNDKELYNDIINMQKEELNKFNYLKIK
jgi:hypothetical protein